MPLFRLSSQVKGAGLLSFATGLTFFGISQNPKAVKVLKDAKTNVEGSDVFKAGSEQLKSWQTSLSNLPKVDFFRGYTLENRNLDDPKSRVSPFTLKKVGETIDGASVRTPSARKS